MSGSSSLGVLMFMVFALIDVRFIVFFTVSRQPLSVMSSSSEDIAVSSSSDDTAVRSRLMIHKG